MCSPQEKAVNSRLSQGLLLEEVLIFKVDPEE